MEEDFVMIPGSGTKKIIRDVKKEIETAFLDYSMSVIVSRALPDVRDGLKPVHRRILYTMHERGNDPSHPYRKSADTVGAVLGSYHPHGDASVYDAMVRLAQDFSLRYPLIDGHGNFGTIDGDPPAAYRYTEARLSKISNEMLRDIEKDYQEQVDIERDKWRKSLSQNRGTVTADDIAKVVAGWTGIPVTRLTEDESMRLLKLEEKLHQRVVGQDDAVTAVAKAIRRSRVGLKDPKRPIGSFLFLGPTGVGKTELCKTLAESMFGDENAMVRIDMSEYMEKYSVSRLIGAPPGYVGYEEGGQLTEAVRRKPYSVVLFDEVEKAHPDVFNVLLQVLDDGRITDSQGRTVNFKNTIIIMTSNLGSQYILDGIDKDGNISSEAKEQVSALLKSTFRPEFLNRLDDIVTFTPLTRDSVKKIIGLLLEKLNSRLERQNLHLKVTDAAKDVIIDGGYDVTFGARPLKRFIESHIETPVARIILSGNLDEGDVIVVDAENGSLKIAPEKPEK